MFEFILNSDSKSSTIRSNPVKTTHSSPNKEKENRFNNKIKTNAE